MSLEFWLLSLLAVQQSTPGGVTSATPGAAAGRFSTLRPVHTYSIVARDPKTGEIGVAVQSHWFSVGSVVPWAVAGVGAVATQSLVDPTYGPLGLAAMRNGRSAPDALRGLLAGDEGRGVRQVAMIDAAGRVAAHTGEKCIAEAGHVVDEANQFSVQANLMEKNTVWGAMAEAYRKGPAEWQKGGGTGTGGGAGGAGGVGGDAAQAGGGPDLADRLIAALEAAEREGGDIRGRQSAAIVIVRAKSTGRPWEDRVFDLRVEDHPNPVAELKRLVGLQRAYNHMNAGDLAIEKGDFEAANRAYSAAAKLAPEIVELPFWQAVTLASKGHVEESLPIFKAVFAKERHRWLPLVRRLAKAGLLPEEEAVLEKIEAQGRD
ncbi:MAG: DUF1028 domain-containing protein [Phycisphaerales bacterium]|nr:DUF1028 domain-containing protein [Phycisphaerales bacterium]